MTTLSPIDARQALRRLVWARAVSALGDGLWFTIWALFFTRVVGLPLGLVGIGMAVAGASGLLAAVPLGALADRRSPRNVLVVITAVRTLAMAGYLLVDGPWAFLVCTTVFVAVANGGNAVRTALVAALVPDTTARIRALAQQRVAQHIGYALGAMTGSFVLVADNRAAYLAAIAVNAVSFAVLAVVTLTLPAPAPSPSRHTARLALRDRPYVVLTATVAVLSLCWAMLSTGLPLWVARSGHLPLALSGVVVALSSIGIAALQIPATRLARTTTQAARTASWSGGVLALSCVALAMSGSPGYPAVAIVLVAAVLHVCGELGYMASSWTLSVTLMREQSRGAYQGVTEAATATVQMLAPAVFTSAIGGFGAAGWLLAAAIFTATAAAVPPLARWTARTR